MPIDDINDIKTNIPLAQRDYYILLKHFQSGKHDESGLSNLQRRLLNQTKLASQYQAHTDIDNVRLSNGQLTYIDLSRQYMNQAAENIQQGNYAEGLKQNILGKTFADLVLEKKTKSKIQVRPTYHSQKIDHVHNETIRSLYENLQKNPDYIPNDSYTQKEMLKEQALQSNKEMTKFVTENIGSDIAAIFKFKETIGQEEQKSFIQGDYKSAFKHFVNKKTLTEIMKELELGNGKASIVSL